MPPSAAQATADIPGVVDRSERAAGGVGKKPASSATARFRRLPVPPKARGQHLATGVPQSSGRVPREKRPPAAG